MTPLRKLDLGKKRPIAEEKRNMDGNYWNGGQVPMGQGGAAAVEQSALGDNARPIRLNDWRAQLPPHSRYRIINYMMENIKKQVPFLGQVLYKKINKAVEEFEKQMYSIATSQSSYLAMISLKMLTIETICYTQTAISQQTNGGSNSFDQVSLDSINQTAGNIGAGDWQEEVYQKIKSMKDKYLLEMNEMYVKIATTMKQHETLPQLRNEHFEKLNFLKHMLERFIQFVQLSKNDIHISHKDKLGSVEKQIISILNIAPLQREQLPQPHMPWMQNSKPQSQISRMQNSRPQSQISHMRSQLQSLNSHIQTHEIGKTGAGDWQENLYQKNSQPQSQISHMRSQLQSLNSHIQTHEIGKTGAGDWQKKLYQKNSQPQSQISHMRSQLQSLNSHMQTHEIGKTGAGDWQEKLYQKNHENQMNPPLMQPMNMQTFPSIEQLIQKLEKLIEEQIDLNIYPKETVSCEGGGFEDMDCR